jgi:F0F1-type ATP synthase membrane subunit c/vacuolar-type H+-ATPase subunit K
MNEDPGWRVSWRVLWFLVPGTAQRALRSAPDGLDATRTLFISFCSSLILFGVVIAFIGDKNATAGIGWLIAIAAWGVASYVVTGAFERPLDCSGPRELGTAYRNRFFLRIAFSESVALFGFVATFAGGPWWAYYFGLPFAVAGLARAAPSVRNIAADQQRLSAAGCAESLVAALRLPPAQSA